MTEGRDARTEEPADVPGDAGPRRRRDIVLCVAAMAFTLLGAAFLAWPLVLDHAAQSSMDQDIDQVKAMRDVLQDGNDDTDGDGGSTEADAPSDSGAGQSGDTSSGDTSSGDASATTSEGTSASGSGIVTKGGLQAAWEYLSQYNQDIRDGRITAINDPWGFTSGSGGFAATSLPDGLVGEIVIPTMDVDLPIYLGSTSANMLRGATVMYGTSAPLGQTDSNCVIAAHRSPRNAGRMFSAIERIKVGDLVYVHTPWDDLAYQVTGFEVVSPNDTSAVHVQAGRDMVTLLTCHPYPACNYRLLVFCDRVAYVDSGETSADAGAGASSGSTDDASAGAAAASEPSADAGSGQTGDGDARQAVPRTEDEQTILGMDILSFQEVATRVGLVVVAVLLVVEVLDLVRVLRRHDSPAGQ